MLYTLTSIITVLTNQISLLHGYLFKFRAYKIIFKRFVS